MVAPTVISHLFAKLERMPASKKKNPDNGLQTFVMIKEAAAAQEIGERIDVPGDFFGADFANAKDDDGKPNRKTFFTCIVKSWDRDRDWGRTELAGAFTIEDNVHDKFEMNLRSYSKYKHDTMKKKSIPPPMAGSSEIGNTDAPSSQEQTGGGASDSPSNPKHSFLWRHVTELTSAEKASFVGSKNCEKTHKCCVTGCGALLRQTNGSTSNLLKHFQTDRVGHRDIADQILAESRNSSVRKTPDGSFVKAKTFEDRLESNIMFERVLSIENRPFQMAKDKHFKAFALNLDLHYILPHRNTSVKISMELGFFRLGFPATATQKTTQTAATVAATIQTTSR
jgi:hypothetical protein